MIKIVRNKNEWNLDSGKRFSWRKVLTGNQILIKNFSNSWRSVFSLGKWIFFLWNLNGREINCSFHNSRQLSTYIISNNPKKKNFFPKIQINRFRYRVDTYFWKIKRQHQNKFYPSTLDTLTNFLFETFVSASSKHSENKLLRVRTTIDSNWGLEK